MYCTNCGSSNLRKNGTRSLSSGEINQRYICNDCKTNFSIKTLESIEPTKRFVPDLVLEGKKFVITSVQNNAEVNHNFLDALTNYCDKNKAKLLIIPTYYQRNLYSDDMIEWDVPEEYLIDKKFSLNNKINVMASMGLLATADNPLGGLDPLSKGHSLIVGHSQIQMRSLPVQRNEPPCIMHTTGTVSYPKYQNSKAGEKAEFNHSFAALVIEFSSDGSYFIRILNCDDQNGFYDVDGYYKDYEFTAIDGVEAVIMGDEHVYVQSNEVVNATYFNKDSIVKALKPKYIVRHDVLDCFTVSHHHRKDVFLQYSKYINDKNRIEDELEKTLKFIIETTPKDSQTLIVSSNHHDHLKRWLNEADPKTEPWNAKIFHELTWLMLKDIEEHDGIHVPDAFALWVNKNIDPIIDRISFVGRNSSFKIHDIEISNHGDIGANGSRGSISQYSKFNEKVVIAHSHTPGINKGAYQVGTSTPKTLEYTNGPSSWMNTHCVIYNNGKRQLISIINGKWKGN